MIHDLYNFYKIFAISYRSSIYCRFAILFILKKNKRDITEITLRLFGLPITKMLKIF